MEQKRAEVAPGRRLKILLAAPAHPLSPSAYYARALRRSHDVLTCGPKIDPRMMPPGKAWEDQHAFKPAGAGEVDEMALLVRLARDNDIPLPWGEVEAAQVAARLPAGWRPDLVVWIDAGPEFLLLDPGHFAGPTACLVGDTHTGQRQWRIDYARQFEQVFLMFARQHVPAFKEGGCARVGWLPAACEPEVHRRFSVPKAYDIVFVDQTRPQRHGDRVRLLARLQQAGFDLRVDSQILEEMALLFSRGRIVFNRSLDGDLNMRVFEALATGSLLLTDRLSPEAGLEELFIDREHLVLYGEDDLEALAAYYLEHEAERERIAEQGHREVLARHTYGHRADQFLAQIFGEGACASCLSIPARDEVPTPVSASGSASVPRVSIVMPVFNQAEYTEQCFYALVENTGDDPDYEIVVVDNGSTDWTRYLLAAFEGDIQVLRNDQNLGFARANNQGAEAARGEYLVFLNNDTVPRPGWLREMVRLADGDPQIGIVGAKLLYPDTNQVQHAGLELKDGIPEHVFRGVDADDPRVDEVRNLDMVTGACMLVRRDLFEALGGFDTGHLNGVEDVDLCLRAREKGCQVVYCPTSVVEHHEGISEGGFDHVRENLQRFAGKWQGRFDASGRFIAGEGPETAALPARTAPRIVRGNWEGSFFLHSSLAHVNRELVLALLDSGRCELGLIPFEPHQFGAEEDPERFRGIAERLDKPLQEEVDFHLRLRWPPDFSRPQAGRLILIQPWEFGRIPKSWVEPLGASVDQIWAPSAYVRNCYVDSGVPPDRVVVVPLGVNPQRFRPGLEPLTLSTEKGFKFLFVGGTLHRKGVDVLLEAYRTCFTPDDDVCLVIKDMGTQTFYRSQNAGEQIRRLQADPACPEIAYLTEDLSDREIPRLYAACDCLVHPYRGEGFGLPAAEAMACGLPVILTAGGACDDFCRGDAVYAIPAVRRPVRFQEETAGPAWLLEPDVEILKRHLRQVVDDSTEARERGQRASEHIRRSFTWEKSAARALEVLEELCGREGSAPKRLFAAPGPEPTPIVKQGSAVVVLGGDGSEPVAAVAAALGGSAIRYDVAVSPQQALGEQLEAIRQDFQGEYLVVLSRGMRLGQGTMGQLLEHARRQEDIALIGPCPPAVAPGGGIEEVEYLSPDCLVIRRAFLDRVGGFDPTFRTEAVFDELARCCRRQGGRVVRVLECVLEQGSEPAGDEPVRQKEQEAVRALVEGDRLKEAGDGDGALEAYRKAVAVKEDFVEPIVVLASLLLEKGRPQEAAQVLQRLVQLDPQSFQAHNLLGLARFQGQDWDPARQSFEQALALNPDYVEALVNLSVLEWGQEEAEKALGYLERAAVLEPGNRDVIVNTGLIQVQVGNVEAALSLFREYARYHPNDLEVLGILMDMLVQSGDMEEARQVAEGILEIQPQHAKARAVVESARE